MQSLQSVLSNRLLENNLITSTRNTDLESVIDAELVPANWKRRHFKVIHKIGIARYQELVHKARKYGRNPQKLLAVLIDKELAPARTPAGGATKQQGPHI